ncbi:hypothetical protein [Streptomyces paludis]|uniref:Uncharacterized protein n=1 Tax=Streptomyces paludis TaxID=2282738 RepID=A0A345HRC0_9ACTN|nr:hypothetical protein [Streptomyces paludis]AXG79244.1 hypothetical protein DVK44_18030 [Streptomyces paludis]
MSMTRNDADADGWLVGEARTTLGAGATAVEVFAVLAERTADWHATALAVCLALGIPATEAERRLDEEFAGLCEEFQPGEETECAGVLEMTGLFDVPRTLDPQDEEVKRLLQTAIGALGKLRSGHAFSLSRQFRTGQLTRAFLSLARVGPRPGHSSASDYWAALVAAGELLQSGDREDLASVEKALEDCRQHTAQSALALG